MSGEWKGLLLGILFSMGVFAVKTGIGLQYAMSGERPGRMRLGVLAAFLALYGLLFAASALWLQRADLPAYVQSAQDFLRWGLLLHLVVAVLMFSWGIALLKSRQEGGSRTLGWLTLVVPCPVCAMVVVLSMGFLMAYFPDAGVSSALFLFGGFVGLSLLSMLLVTGWSRIFALSPERALGLAMMVLAAYFLLSILIMPHFAGLDEVFRLAAYSHRGHGGSSLAGWAIAGAQGMLFAAGYLKMRGNMRRSICSKSARS